MLIFLALMVAMTQAALVKVDSASDPLMVYVNGQYQGMTPVILEFDDGYYRVDFREDEFTGPSMRYSLDVRGQSKGKLTCDWEMDDFRMVWAEDLQRSSSSSSSSSSSDARRQAEARLQAELERRRAEEEARRRDEEGDDDLDWENVDDLGWAEEDELPEDLDESDWEEEELRRAEAEAEARRRSEAETRRDEELRAEDLQAQARALEEEARRLQDQARQRAEEAKRLAAEDARRRAEDEARRKAEEAARLEAEREEARLAERERLEQEAAAKAAEAEARREAELERQRREDEARRLVEEQRQKEEEEKRRRAEEARRAKFMPHRDAGDAAVQAGDTRLAVRAYRQAVAAGDDDPETAKTIRALDAELGTLRITMSGIQEGTEPSISIDPPQGEAFPPDSVQRNRYTFTDVPAETALDLHATGVGYQPLETTLEPIRPKRQARVNAELSWLGTATLELQDWPEGVSVTVTDLGTKHEPAEEGELLVTAGRLVVALDGPSGKRQFLLELEADGSQAVVVRDQLPGAVRIAGVPAGSRLGLAASPEGAKLTTTMVPRDAGAQEQAGVAIAEPVLLQNLPPGEYTISVDHPVLGTGRVSFQPEPGETSEASLVWESMSKAAAVRDARELWERRKARSEKMPLAHKLALGTAGASVALAGVSAAMFTRSIGERSELGDLDSGYDQAMTDQDYNAAWELFSQRVEVQDSLRSSNTITLGGLGVSVAGLGVSTTLYLRGRVKKRSVADWDLWALGDLPSTPDPVLLPPPDDEPAAKERKKKKPEKPEDEPAAEAEPGAAEVPLEEDSDPAAEPGTDAAPPDTADEAPAEEVSAEDAPAEEPEAKKINAEDDEFYVGPDEAFEPDFSVEEEEFEMEPAAEETPAATGAGE